MKVFIYTSYNCLIKTDYAEETIEENQHLILEELPKKLSVYPTGKNPLPSFNIEFDHELSPYYRIVKKDEKMLIFLIDGIYTQNIQVHSFSYEGERCQIEVGKREVSFTCKKNKKILHLPDNILSSKCGNFFHIAYSKIDTENLEYLLAYNIKTYQTKILKGEKIEVVQDGFIVHSTSHGYKNIEEHFVVKKEGLKIKERTFNLLALPTFEQTLAFRFLNSVKHGDYDFALSVLSDNLKSTLTKSSLREYFGDISYLFPLDENTCFCISNNKNTIYTFSIENNKINDINDE